MNEVITAVGQGDSGDSGMPKRKAFYRGLAETAERVYRRGVESMRIEDIYDEMYQDVALPPSAYDPADMRRSLRKLVEILEVDYKIQALGVTEAFFERLESGEPWDESDVKGFIAGSAGNSHGVGIRFCMGKDDPFLRYKLQANLESSAGKLSANASRLTDSVETERISMDTARRLLGNATDTAMPGLQSLPRALVEGEKRRLVEG